MEDRFKYRAFYVEENKMKYWEYDTPEAFFYYMGKDCMDFSKKTVFMQCTTLKDMKGKLIYEFDILNVKYNYIGNVVVEFENGKYNISNYDLSSCEVIGNKFEHKHLLEK